MPTEKGSSSESTGREIAATRLVRAPRELVWKMWTDPEHVVKWWGPNGFTTTVQEMEVKPGGAWRHILHGPDGVDYPNHSVYTEVVPPERLIYEHVSDPKFTMNVLFTEKGDDTEIAVRMVFETASLRDKVAKAFRAVEGLSQTLQRLEDILNRC